MFVNPKYLYEGIPAQHVRVLEKLPTTPLALDICRLSKNPLGGTDSRLKIVSAGEGSAEGIDIALENGIPVLKITGPDSKGEYDVSCSVCDLKSRGDNKMLTSKRIGYLLKAITPRVQDIMESGDRNVASQLTSSFTFYQRRVQDETDYAGESKMSIDFRAFHEFVKAAREGADLTQLTAATMGHINQVFASASQRVSEGMQYISKLNEFVHAEKFICGWARRGVFFGVAKLGLNAALNPILQEWRVPMRFYRNWAAMQPHHPELHREVLASLGFLKAHREGGTMGAESRDAEKLFPAGDWAFLDMNAVSYFTAGISRRNPQWLILDRLLVA